ncbi:MAG: hypothetical protein ABSC51_10365 [Gaiellaceae bacterium]|jgi:hypothetical protein
MKRKLAFSTAVLTLFAVAFIALQATAAPRTEHAIKHKSGKITIQRWLHAAPNANNLALASMGCFKLSINGEPVDQGGGPTWTNDASYTNDAAAASQCANEEPIGGGIIEPGAPYAAVYGAMTLTGRKGQIFITVAGDYNMGDPVENGLGALKGYGHWTITGGTGAYKGLQGQGEWTASLGALALKMPYCRHLETGHVWWTK